MTEPFAQDLRLYAPWGLVTRVQAPEGWQFDQLTFCHNTHNLLKTAAESRRTLTDGYLLRAVYLVGSVVEVPIHLHGFTIPR